MNKDFMKSLAEKAEAYKQSRDAKEAAEQALLDEENRKEGAKCAGVFANILDWMGLPFGDLKYPEIEIGDVTISLGNMGNFKPHDFNGSATLWVYPSDGSKYEGQSVSVLMNDDPGRYCNLLLLAINEEQAAVDAARARATAPEPDTLVDYYPVDSYSSNQKIHEMRQSWTIEFQQVVYHPDLPGIVLVIHWSRKS